MVYKKRRSAMRKRSRRNYKGRRYNRRRYIINRAVVPDHKVVKMRYCQVVNINPGAGVATSNIFWANSIYDPDYTGTGHQPMGHDQWANFYNHYTVLGAKCTAVFSSPSSTAGTGNGIVGIHLKDDNTGIGGSTSIIEQSLATWKVMATKDGGTTNVTRVTKTFSAKKFFGLKDVKDNRLLVGASMGANPSDGAFFHVFVGNLGAIDDVGGTDVLVTIEYIVLLTERKTLIQS